METSLNPPRYSIPIFLQNICLLAPVINDLEADLHKSSLSENLSCYGEVRMHFELHYGDGVDGYVGLRRCVLNFDRHCVESSRREGFWTKLQRPKSVNKSKSSNGGEENKQTSQTVFS